MARNRRSTTASTPTPTARQAAATTTTGTSPWRRPPWSKKKKARQTYGGSKKKGQNDAKEQRRAATRGDAVAVDAAAQKEADEAEKKRKEEEQREKQEQQKRSGRTTLQRLEELDTVGNASATLGTGGVQSAWQLGAKLAVEDKTSKNGILAALRAAAAQHNGEEEEEVPDHESDGSASDIDPEDDKFCPMGVTLTESFLLFHGLAMGVQNSDRPLDDFDDDADKMEGPPKVDGTLVSGLDVRNRHILSACILADLFMREKVAFDTWALEYNYDQYSGGPIATPFQVHCEEEHMARWTTEVYPPEVQALIDQGRPILDVWEPHFLEYFIDHVVHMYEFMKLPHKDYEEEIWANLCVRGYLDLDLDEDETDTAIDSTASPSTGRPSPGRPSPGRHKRKKRKPPLLKRVVQSTMPVVRAVGKVVRNLGRKAVGKSDLTRQFVLLKEEEWWDEWKRDYVDAYSLTLEEGFFYNPDEQKEVLLRSHKLMFFYALQEIFELSFETPNGFEEVFQFYRPPFCKMPMAPPRGMEHAAGVVRGLLMRAFRAGTPGLNNDLPLEVAAHQDDMLTQYKDLFYTDLEIGSFFQSLRNAEAQLIDFPTLCDSLAANVCKLPHFEREALVAHHHAVLWELFEESIEWDDDYVRQGELRVIFEEQQEEWRWNMSQRPKKRATSAEQEDSIFEDARGLLERIAEINPINAINTLVEGEDLVQRAAAEAELKAKQDRERAHRQIRALENSPFTWDKATLDEVPEAGAGKRKDKKDKKKKKGGVVGVAADKFKEFTKRTFAVRQGFSGGFMPMHKKNQELDQFSDDGGSVSSSSSSDDRIRK